MTEEFDLRSRPILELGCAKVRVVDHGEISVELDDGDPPLRMKISDDRSGVVRCRSAGSWLVAVGEEGDRVASVDLDSGDARILRGLARLDLQDGYDPGGMFRVDFFATSDAARLMVATEASLTCITPQAIVWRYVHGDVTCRVTELTDVAVVISGEHGAIAVGLADGKEIL